MRNGAIIGASKGSYESIRNARRRSAEDGTRVHRDDGAGGTAREALKSLIAREAGRRLLALAGTAPNIKDVRRRRVDEP